MFGLESQQILLAERIQRTFGERRCWFARRGLWQRRSRWGLWERGLDGLGSWVSDWPSASRSLKVLGRLRSFAALRAGSGWHGPNTEIPHRTEVGLRPRKGRGSAALHIDCGGASTIK